MLETLLLALLALAAIALTPYLKKKRANNSKYQKILEDFRAQVDTMLRDGETVEAICGYYPCAAVTNYRLLIGGKKGIDSVAFAAIEKINGLDHSANKTSNADAMMMLEFKAGKNMLLAIIPKASMR